MPRSLRSTLGLVGFACFFALGACERAAPDPDASDPAGGAPAAPIDPAHLEVAGYLLTADRVDRFFDASQAVADTMAAMAPEARERVEAAINPDEPSPEADDVSLDEFAARIAAEDVVRGAVEAAGLSPREYAVLTLALIQTGMAEAVIAAHPSTADPDSLARALGADPRNVAFVRTHAAELRERQQALDAVLDRIHGPESPAE